MALKQSVIICTRNRIHDVISCLRSLSKQTRPPEELIIVDSSDTPLQQNVEFVDIFNELFSLSGTVQYLHTRPGLTYQRNRGIAQAHGDIIYFFDDDVELKDNYLEVMHNTFTTYPEYAGGMGTISNITPLSWRYRLFRTVFLLQRTYSTGLFTASGMPTHPYGTKQFKKVEVLGGCCMAFRKEVLSLEKFDETFKGYAFMEDSDIARRISVSRPLFFNPAAQLAHLESPIARDRTYDSSQMFAKNYSYLFFKHFYRRNKLKLVAYWWSIFGLFLEAFLLRDWCRLAGYYYGFKQFHKERK